jgi:hypothetical protein
MGRSRACWLISESLFGISNDNAYDRRSVPAERPEQLFIARTTKCNAQPAARPIIQCSQQHRHFPGVKASRQDTVPRLRPEPSPLSFPKIRQGSQKQEESCLTRPQLVVNFIQTSSGMSLASTTLGAVRASIDAQHGKPGCDLHGRGRFQVCSEQLLKDWAAFPGTAKARCVLPREYVPSYIEWLTCLEMEGDASKIRQEQPEQEAAPIPASSPAARSSLHNAAKKTKP